MALNITYSAWAIIWGFILLGNGIDLKSMICCLMIIIGSIIASGDLKEIFKIDKSKRLVN